MMGGTLLSVVLCAASSSAGLAGPPPVSASHFAFVEPDPGPPGGEPPLFRRVSDPEKLGQVAKWADNDAARWALDIYSRARMIAVRRGVDTQPSEYFIAVVPDGNNAAIGFRLRDGRRIESYPRAAYVRLGPQRWRFVSTLLHETGHVVLAMLAGGREVPKREIAAIPHTVAALSDRGTAFDEGFAIHLETLVAHVSSAPEIRRQYRHEGFLFGPEAGMRSEYFAHSVDLLSFAQTKARYGDVRDNDFAFSPAFKGPDYARTEMETARDFASLRDANQLLQSEGFYASFFFSFLVRGESTPTPDVLRARQEHVLTALANMLENKPFTPEAPYLLEFVESYRKLYPAEAAEILDVFLDLTHGVFVDPEAASLWRDHYLAALKLDLSQLGRDRIAAAGERWRAAVAKDAKILYSRLGPQLRCEVTGRTVKLEGLGRDVPLSLDVNTAEEGVVRLIPGISDTDVASWLAERARNPFADVQDFKQRVPLSEKVLESLRF
jgi:hypothetical protein